MFYQKLLDISGITLPDPPMHGIYRKDQGCTALCLPMAGTLLNGIRRRSRWGYQEG